MAIIEKKYILLSVRRYINSFYSALIWLGKNCLFFKAHFLLLVNLTAALSFWEARKLSPQNEGLISVLGWIQACAENVSNRNTDIIVLFLIITNTVITSSSCQLLRKGDNTCANNFYVESAIRWLSVAINFGPIALDMELFRNFLASCMVPRQPTLMTMNFWS
jgi:hypothetical protein